MVDDTRTWLYRICSANHPYSALARAPAKSSNLMYLQILIAPFWDYFIFAGSETSNWADVWGVSGILLILSGASIVTFGAKKSPQKMHLYINDSLSLFYAPLQECPNLLATAVLQLPGINQP